MTAEEIAVKLANHENRLKVTEHRLSDLEEAQKQIYDLTISVKELAMSVRSMVEEQKAHGERIGRLEEEPNEQMKFLWKTILAAVLGVLGGALGTGLLNLL